MSDTPLLAEQSSASQSHADELIGLFFPDGIGEVAPVGGDELPAMFQTLLAHNAHMTVTLEACHESLVDLKVVGERHDGSEYSRHSVLTRQTDSRPVQAGVMRVRLTALPPAVRSAVELREMPLGRILIRSNLLRIVEPLAFWRIKPVGTLAADLGTSPGEVIYGRSARILVEGEPVVELLEIVRP